MHQKHLSKKIIPNCIIRTGSKLLIISKNANKLKLISNSLAFLQFCEMHVMISNHIMIWPVTHTPLL